MPVFFFFNAPATSGFYALSLHDALPICSSGGRSRPKTPPAPDSFRQPPGSSPPGGCRKESGAGRSEEHTSELQSRFDLVCRLLLEKKKNITSAYVQRYSYPRSYVSLVSH